MMTFFGLIHKLEQSNPRCRKLRLISHWCQFLPPVGMPIELFDIPLLKGGFKVLLLIVSPLKEWSLFVLVKKNLKISCSPSWVCASELLCWEVICSYLVSGPQTTLLFCTKSQQWGPKSSKPEHLPCICVLLMGSHCSTLWEKITKQSSQRRSVFVGYSSAGTGSAHLRSRNTEGTWCIALSMRWIKKDGAAWRCCGHGLSKWMQIWNKGWSNTAVLWLCSTENTASRS